jgi:hypothetical protein
MPLDRATGLNQATTALMIQKDTIINLQNGHSPIVVVLLTHHRIFATAV